MHFLCIDDDPLNLQVLTDMLQVAGGTSDAFTNGVAGIVALAEKAYDMVLVDLRMPGMDGISFVEHVRAQAGSLQNMPIIVVTAEGRGREMTRCLAAGADGIICKPVVMDTLYENVAAVFSSRDATNALM